MVDDEVSAKLSVLGQLRTRHDEIVAGEHKDLPVPRWTDPAVWVRYRPLAHEEVRRIQIRLERVPKQKRIAAEVDYNSDLLIVACMGVYGVLDGERYSLRPGDPMGDWTLFDPDLAVNLGLESDASARQVVRALFITDADILSCAKSLIEWSGYTSDEAEEAFEGE